MKRIISIILVAATVSGASAPAFAGSKHGSKGAAHMSSHGGKGGFGHFGGKGLAAGVIGAAFGAILVNALANQ